MIDHHGRGGSCPLRAAQQLRENGELNEGKHIRP